MKLKKLTQEEYDKYIIKSLESYKKEITKSGVSEEKAHQSAEAQFKQILPQGMETPNHYFNFAYDQDTLVGFIWYGLRDESSAFIFDFYIEEDMRRKGYGKKVMLACEKEAKEKGITEMRLHVFGHNEGARKLYESLNYIPTNIQMKKQL